MNLKLELHNPFWWLWTITLVFIVIALAGWQPAYSIVVTISALQVILFLVREKQIMAFPVQIRIVYFIWALSGLWVAGKFAFYVLLLLGSIMLVFFGRRSDSLTLKNMPWNRPRIPLLVRAR